LEWSPVVEALEAGSIIVGDEAIEEGVALGVRGEEPVGAALFGLLADGFDDAPVEALDEAVGLGPIGPGEAMIDALPGATSIEGMAAGGLVEGLVLHVDGEAVGELAAIVGEDGVDRVREVSEEAGRGLAVPPGVDLQIDVAGGPVDGDEGIALAPFQGGQMFEIHMDEADRGRLEDADRGLAGLGAPVQAMALEAAIEGGARKPGVETAMHHLGDVVERQAQLGT
jgi:hypothetical protein